jgi:hypothetical protein
MKNTEYEDIGFIKYSGEAVPHGIIDASSAGVALIGLSETIRFFNEKQSPAFAKMEYEIPVRTEGGSWGAYVLAAVGAGASVFALGYLKKAGEKMADNDFKDIGLKDVLKKSLSAVQYLVQLVKHTRLLRGWDISKVSWRSNGDEVGINNRNGEVIFIPVEFFTWYGSLSPRLISKMTMVVKVGCKLTIGVLNDGIYKEVTVDEKEKTLFSQEQIEVEEDVLFPELEHGSFVKLEGKLIRGNEASNSVGLEYEGHILNCVPEYGNVRQFKQALFLKCIIEGTVSRLTKQRFVAEKRPKIILSKVTPIEGDDQYNLFKG